MITLILLVLLIILSMTLAILLTTHRNKRISSEIIRRLDEHHQNSLSNTLFMREQTDKISKEAVEIRQFFEHLNKATLSKTEELNDFINTNRFKL